jgi:hypothetical protein
MFRCDLCDEWTNGKNYGDQYGKICWSCAEATKPKEEKEKGTDD